MLVVAPLSVVPVWLEELAKEHVPARALRSKNVSSQDVREGMGECIWVTNYECVRVRSDLAADSWDAVILDESTRIKNPKTLVTKVCTKGFRDVVHRMILTGMPAPESRMDYFCQFQFLHGGFAGYRTYWDFRQRYFSRVEYDWIPKRGTFRTIREEVAKRAVVMRRKDVRLGEKKIYEKRYVEMTASQRYAYERTQSDFEVDNTWTNFVPVKYGHMLRLTGGINSAGEVLSWNKIEEVLTLLKGELSGQKVVIFAKFIWEIYRLEESLKRAGFARRSIHGAVDPETREAWTCQFQDGTNTACQVLVCQAECAKFGLDFSRASAVIFYSRAHSLESRKQCEDRILSVKKIKQKIPMLIIDVITKDSIDEDVVEALAEKHDDNHHFNQLLFKLYCQKRCNNARQC